MFSNHAFVFMLSKIGISYKARKRLRRINSPAPSFMRGVGVFFFLHFPHTDHMNILQEIFSDHYEEMVYTLHPRDAVIENVKKILPSLNR